ncbi:MAG: hypothetical protein M1483_03170 [Actinobacteria bacterium]|nr:hypothetical protein [Actinomycetota bacterium]MCL6104626.1 hypothetical protein [Actinomycetota bacterium]
MAREVTTKDCVVLDDTELADMAEVGLASALPGALNAGAFDVGLLSKQRDEWVLATQCWENKKLRGFAFSTLERIGGTPSILIGIAGFDRKARSEAVLRAVMGELYKKALLAFPDEDVLLATRLISPEGYQLFKGVRDIVPRPGYSATGEEKAWGKRLAKRFSATGSLDDSSFALTGETSPGGVTSFGSNRLKVDLSVAKLFKGLNPSKGDCLVVFGWIMAEDLALGKL